MMTMYPSRLRRWSLLIVIFWGLSAQCQQLTIAAAADLQPVMQDVSSAFEKDSGTAVKVSYGSSGNFTQQIKNGAPFDIFFSANLDYAKELELSGFSEPGTLYKYAVGKIVIWAPAESKLELNSGMRVLLNPAITKIAIANPQHAPYGKAAVAALQNENLYDQVKAKLVLGENISQTMTFVMSGSADVGIVALSLALSPNIKDKGRYAQIPDSDYSPIEQACIVLRSSKNKDLAKRFVAFLNTPKIRESFRRYGFELPQAQATGSVK